MTPATMSNRKLERLTETKDNRKLKHSQSNSKSKLQRSISMQKANTKITREKCQSISRLGDSHAQFGMGNINANVEAEMKAYKTLYAQAVKTIKDL